MSHFLFLDAARLEGNLTKAIELNKHHSCLYKLKARDDLACVAPYLFAIHKSSEFTNWYIGSGWGQSWGLLVQTNLTFEDTYKHFRKFLMVKTEDGKELYFRFYDPRVLRIFLPTCDSTQLKEFFGPIDFFVVEDEDPSYALLLSERNGQLNINKVLASEFFTERFGFWKAPEQSEHAGTGAQSPVAEESVQTPPPPPKRKYRFMVDE